MGWQNDDGDTALHLACFGAPAAALVLAKAGAPRDVLNNREETPDDLARRAGLRLDPGVPLPLPPAPAPAPPPPAPAPAPRPKPPQQKAKPPVRVPTGGKYAKPRGRAPLNAEGKPASWDPDLGEWVGACAASDMTFSVTPSPRRRRRGMPSLVLVASMAFSHVCYVRHRPELVLLQYYRRPLPNNILIRTRRRRQEEEAERDSETSRKGSLRCDVGLRQGRVGRRERQTEASRGEEAGAQKEGCGSSHDGREGRGLARYCAVGWESYSKKGATGGGINTRCSRRLSRCEESGGERSLSGGSDADGGLGECSGGIAVYPSVPGDARGGVSKGFSCIFLFVSRRWRFDAARLRVVWLGRGPRLPHRLLSNTCAASVSPAASFIFFVVLVGLLRLQAGTSTEESSRACKSPIHHIHETTHVNCSGVARRIDCRAQPSYISIPRNLLSRR